MSELSKWEKRKYAQALRRIEYGVWGRSVGIFREITLTTRQGDDNSTKRFGKDLRKLIIELRAMGYEIEYCGCYELSPANNLLHWHGLLRIKGGYFPVSVGELGKMWGKFHNAPIVDLEGVRSMHDLIDYIGKHMVKDYLAEQAGIRNKFLFSRGWVRPGIKELTSEFKRWWINRSVGSWMDSKGYKVMNEMLRGWCEGKLVYVKTKDGYFKAQGSMIDYDIEGE